MAVTIENITSPTTEVIEALARLVPQLSSAPPPDAEAVAAMLARGSILFIARMNGQIVGTLTLILYHIPTGLKAWIEDVVVDDSARGQGVGEALNLAALDEARRHGARAVSLTSRPFRDAANRLYLRLGFAPRDTNVYRYYF